VGEGSGNVSTDLGHADSESMLVKAQLAAIVFLKVTDLKGVRAEWQLEQARRSLVSKTS